MKNILDNTELQIGYINTKKMPYQCICHCHSHSNTIYEYKIVKHSVVKIMIHLQFRHILEVNMLTI